MGHLQNRCLSRGRKITLTHPIASHPAALGVAGAQEGEQPSVCPSHGSLGREPAPGSRGRAPKHAGFAAFCTSLCSGGALAFCRLGAGSVPGSKVGITEVLAFGKLFLLGPASRKPLPWRCPWWLTSATASRSGPRPVLKASWDPCSFLQPFSQISPRACRLAKHNND